MLTTVAKAELAARTRVGSGFTLTRVSSAQLSGPWLQRCGGGRCLPGTCDHDEPEGASTLRLSGTASRPHSVPHAVDEVLRAPGEPLPEPGRAYFEPRLGHDFGKVRIHTDSRAAASARAVNALAYTVGEHIAFADGHYQLDTTNGRRVLAHELVHTIQQGVVQPYRTLTVSDRDDRDELAAETIASGTVDLPGSASTAPKGIARMSRWEDRLQRLNDASPEVRSPAQTAEDDGVGPEEARKAFEDEIGADFLLRLEEQAQGGTGHAPGEEQATQVATMALSRGTQAVGRLLNAPPIQTVGPLVVLGGVLLAAVLCALPFNNYAMDHYSSRSDKWKHCWVSCKITTYCGTPLIGDVVAILIGAGKEALDYICDVLGGPCGAEWEDFVADVDGIGCGMRITESCVSCCNRVRP